MNVNNMKRDQERTKLTLIKENFFLGGGALLYQNILKSFLFRVGMNFKC